VPKIKEKKVTPKIVFKPSIPRMIDENPAWIKRMEQSTGELG
jgi:hypothetical protein